MTQDNTLPQSQPEPQAPPQMSKVFAPSKVTVQSLSQSIQDSLRTFLTNSGQNVTDVEASLQAYMTRIQPILEAQVERANTDPDVAYTNVKYLWANVAAESGRVSLGAIFKERQAVTAIVIAVLHTAIALA